MSGPRIGFLLERHPTEHGKPWVSAVVYSLLAHLERRGAAVDPIVPEDRVWELRGRPASHDLYVLKSETALALGVAGALAARGATVVNSHRAVTVTRDKIVSTALLAAAGVAVPESHATGSLACLSPLLRSGALWVKPQGGTRGSGVVRVGAPEEISRAAVAAGDAAALLAQREAPSHGRDLKVYVVGERAWALERPFPAVTEDDKRGRPVPLPGPVLACALACGRALQLEIYGVDVLASGDRFAVVDVNAFPGYKGLDEAPEALAEYLFRRAEAARARAAAGGEDP